MTAQSFRGAGAGGAVVTRYRHEALATTDYELTPLTRDLDAYTASTEKLLAQAAAGLLLVILLLVGAWVMWT